MFISAFDNAVISRFNDSREVVDKINVRYQYAPKQRVLYDLVNKANNITLPVVAFTISSLTRNPARQFNKQDGSYYNGVSGGSRHLPQPVPVDIGINMSIITKYQADADQIISNFVPYADPYIIISWVRSGMPNQEIRIECEWSGGLNMTYPVDINGNQPARVAVDTSFVIKAWLFKAEPDTSVARIFRLTDSFITAGIEYSSEDSTRLMLTGVPKIYSVYPYAIPVQLDTTGILLKGSMFAKSSAVYLSAGANIFDKPLSAFDPFAGTSLSATYPAISAIPATYSILSNEVISFDITSPLTTGKFDVIVVNPAGYTSLMVDTTSHGLSSTYQYPFQQGISIS